MLKFNKLCHDTLEKISLAGLSVSFSELLPLSLLGL